MTFQNRIVGEGIEKPENLLANPANWRLHPQFQQDALKGVLNEIGWVQRVIVNQRTGYVVDGHARVAVAMREGATEVPVLYVDLSEREEALILATLDPIGGLAGTDGEQLRALLEDVSTGDAALQQLLADMAKGVEPVSIIDPGLDDEPDDQSGYKEQYGVIVICKSEGEQEQAYNRLMELGYECKVVCT